MLEQRDQIGRDRQADFEALEVVGGVDRLGPRGDVAEAMVEALVDHVEADLLRDFAQIPAEIAVHRLPDMGVAVEGEADAEHAAGRVARGKQINRQEIALQGAGDGLRDHRRVLAEHAVGVERDGQPAVALLLDPVHRLAGADAHRMPVGQRGAAFVIELGGMGGVAQNEGRRNQGPGGNTGPREQGPTRHAHSSFLPHLSNL